jgi:hypothetical protein
MASVPQNDDLKVKYILRCFPAMIFVWDPFSPIINTNQHPHLLIKMGNPAEFVYDIPLTSLGLVDYISQAWSRVDWSYLQHSLIRDHDHPVIHILYDL